MRVLFLTYCLIALAGCSSFIEKTPRTPSSQAISSNCYSTFLALQDGRHLSGIQKARSINDQEGAIKGAFAEIGAGQEVAGNFFAAKRASETVVRTFSAYGKEESDKVYGAGQRYVSSGRLKDMLEFEFNNLATHRQGYAENTRLFAFANSVTTNKDGSGHGWIGLRFQPTPDAEPMDIIIHANFGKTAVTQQHEDIGELGVNLIHAAFSGESFNPRHVSARLMDNIPSGNINVDLIEISGRIMNQDIFDKSASTLKLLEGGKTEMLLFDANGNPATGKDLFYKKHVFLRQFDIKNEDQAFVNGRQLMANAEGFDSTNEIQIRQMSFKHFTKNGEIGPEGYAARMRELTQNDNAHILIHDGAGMNKLSRFITDSLNSSNSIMLTREMLESISDIESFLKQAKNPSSPLKFYLSANEFQKLEQAAKEIVRRLETESLLQII